MQSSSDFNGLDGNTCAAALSLALYVQQNLKLFSVLFNGTFWNTVQIIVTLDIAKVLTITG